MSGGAALGHRRRRSPYGRPLAFGLVAAFLSLLWAAPLSAIGLGITAYAFVRYVESLGESLAIIEIISLIAAVQWLAAPFLAYWLGNLEVKYFMRIPEAEYMAYAVPAILMFITGMEWAKGRSNFSVLVERLKHSLRSRTGSAYLLVLAGLMAGFMSDYVPAALRFVFFFVAQLKYIGVLYLLLSRDRWKWHVAAVVWVLTAASSLDEGLFHNLILWSAFIFSFICLERNFNRTQKYLLIFLAGVGIVMLQSVKAEYREMVLENAYTGSKAVLVVNLLVNPSLRKQHYSQAHRVSFINTRFNQGWIIAAVMNYVPRNRPHENGATIVDAVRDSMVPRFLVDKKRVWVSDKFMQYTGLRVGKTTSMGISVLGEAYVNFGKFGGAWFMLAWGVFTGLIFRLLIRQSEKRPTLILWAPLIFLQVVKAETELLVVLNHLVKAIVFTWAFYWFTVRVLRWQL